MDVSSLPKSLNALAAVVVVVLAVLAAGVAYLSYQVARLGASVAALSREVNSTRSELNSTLSSMVTSRLQALAEELAQSVAQVNQSLLERIEGLETSLRYPVVIVDALNQTVVIPYKPTRIVSLDPASTEILLALGEARYLVGVDNDSLYYLPPPYNYTVRELVSNGTAANIGSTYSGPDISEILALDPQLVVGTAGWGYNNYIAQVLSQYGIPVLLLPSTQSLSDIYRSIVMVGEATGAVQEAVELVENISSQVQAVEAALRGAAPVNVTVILWVNPTYAAGGGTFINDLITLAGGENVFSNFSGWPVVSAEELLAANPQVIILMSNGGLFNASSLESWLSSEVGPAYRDVAAFRYGRVYVIGGWYESVLSEPSVMVALGLRLLAEILHPQAFNLTSVPSYVTPATLPPGAAG